MPNAEDLRHCWSLDRNKIMSDVERHEEWLKSLDGRVHKSAIDSAKLAAFVAVIAGSLPVILSLGIRMLKQ